MPVVFDRKDDHVLGAGLRRDPNLAALGEFHGVGQEIPENLRDFSFVGLHRGDAGRRVENQRHRVVIDHRPNRSLQALEERP